jgi:hypothetical protein
MPSELRSHVFVHMPLGLRLDVLIYAHAYRAMLACACAHAFRATLTRAYALRAMLACACAHAVRAMLASSTCQGRAYVRSIGLGTMEGNVGLGSGIMPK